MATAPTTGFDQSPQQATARDWRHLGLVLWVTLSIPIVSSTYYVLGGTTGANTTQYHTYRLLGGLIDELTALAVLWYVMRVQGRTGKDIGWNPGLRDIPRAVVLFVVARSAAWVAYTIAQYTFYAYSGHFLVAKSLAPILGFGISGLSIAFVCLNPFFEELTVRAYTMSEVMNLGGSRTLAVLISVVAQVSYHLYQGFTHVIGATVLFTVFSIYYVRTRRILPVILVHLAMDWLALLAGKF